MATNYGMFKMVTASGVVYADRVRDLVDLLPGSEISAVFEFNTTTRKYRPNESAKNWLCERRGQALPAQPEAEPNEMVRMFREMMDLSREMGRSPEEQRAALESAVSAMPIKSKPTAQDRYAAKNLRQFMVKINRATEPELLAHLESVDNVQGYIKSLIRADMERQAGE